MQHIRNTLPNIYCHPELSLLHCIVVLFGSMKRASQFQDGCCRKLIGDTLQIFKILKPGGRFSS